LIAATGHHPLADAFPVFTFFLLDDKGGSVNSATSCSLLSFRVLLVDGTLGFFD
jgi:hypothetical protein